MRASPFRLSVISAGLALGLISVPGAGGARPPPPSTPAPALAASPPWLISSWNAAEMKVVVSGMGMTVVKDTHLDNGDPLIVVRSESGASFVIEGTACTGTGAAARCLGANLTAFIRYETPAKLEAARTRIDYPAVTLAFEEANTLSVGRYIVFDEGIHRKNLEANIRLFVAIVDEARAMK